MARCICSGYLVANVIRVFDTIFFLEGKIFFRRYRYLIKWINLVDRIGRIVRNRRIMNKYFKY